MGGGGGVGDGSGGSGAGYVGCARNYSLGLLTFTKANRVDDGTGMSDAPFEEIVHASN